MQIAESCFRSWSAPGIILEFVCATSSASAHWSSLHFPSFLCHLTGATVLLARQLPGLAWVATDCPSRCAVFLSCRLWGQCQSPGHVSSMLSRAQSTDSLNTFLHISVVSPRSYLGWSGWNSNGSSATDSMYAGGAHKVVR